MIDVETLMNDKKLLLEEVKDLREALNAYKTMHNVLTEELGKAWDQVYALTDEVNRLTALVEDGGHLA